MKKLFYILFLLFAWGIAWGQDTIYTKHGTIDQVIFYNESDSIIRIEKYSLGDLTNRSEIESIITYERDTLFHNKTTETHYMLNRNTNKLEPSHQVIEEYDSIRHCTTWVNKIYEFNSFENYQKNEAEYHLLDEGFAIKSRYYYWDTRNNEWVLNTKSDCIYNKDTLLTSKMYHNIDMNYLPHIKYIEYDANRRPIFSYSVRVDSTGNIIDTVFYNKTWYNERNLVAKSISFNKDEQTGEKRWEKIEKKFNKDWKVIKENTYIKRDASEDWIHTFKKVSKYKRKSIEHIEYYLLKINNRVRLVKYVKTVFPKNSVYNQQRFQWNREKRKWEIITQELL